MAHGKDPLTGKSLRLRVVGVDPDPLPRPAPVQPSSAFTAVATARAATPASITIGPAQPPPPARRLRPLRTWDFDPGIEQARPVIAPHTWSRREPALDDHRGPCRYSRLVTVEGPYARLVFDAIDYVGEVYADGARVAVHEGGFTPVAIELPTGRPVNVEVVVHDPAEESLRSDSPLLLPKRKIKGVHDWHDSRPGGLAVGEMFDPRWTRRWGSGGLGAVFVHETGALRLDAVFVTPSTDQISISWVVSNLTDDEQPAKLSAAIGAEAITTEVTLRPGASRVAVVVAIEGFPVWSPDEPTLVSVVASVSTGGAVSDSLVVTTGLRAVAMDVAGPRQFQLSLNGQPTYVKAANYIGGIWPFELEEPTVATDVALAKSADLNSFGVHAGVCPPLYDIADREGLLVFQDFPLQWSYDPHGAPLVADGPDFRTASTQLAAEFVYALYNHPSIVYWCGHNEPAYQLKEAFAEAETPELAPLADAIADCPDESDLDEERAALMRRIDPTRPVVAASGLGASRPDGDAHDYAGSLSGGHALDGVFGKAAFISEYGAWSANFSAAKRAVAARGDWPPPAAAERDWHEQTHLVGIQNAYAGNPGRFDDFSTWCFAGQLWSGWHAKVCTEAIRLSQFAPAGGHRWHFFVDHWGDGGAGLVDRFRVTGPAYRGFAAANRPVLPVVPLPERGRVEPGSTVQLPVSVINDTADPVRAALSWRVVSLGADDAFLVGRDEPDRRMTLQAEVAPEDHVCVLPRRFGRELAAGEIDVAVAPHSVEQVVDPSWRADIVGPVAMVVEVAGVVNWTAFVVQDSGWTPTPGLVGPRRFRVTSERPGTLRRRWTGEVIDPDNAPPDQYLWDDIAVDVYDDVHIKADGSTETAALPWPAVRRD